MNHCGKKNSFMQDLSEKNRRSLRKTGLHGKDLLKHLFYKLMNFRMDVLFSDVQIFSHFGCSIESFVKQRRNCRPQEMKHDDNI